MGQHYFWMGGMWIFPIICMICMMFLFFRSRRDGNSCFGPFNYSEKNTERNSESAIEILKKRYAKGEITKDEYDHIKNDLLKE